MIVFDLECSPAGHRFEGWFASSNDFAEQLERGLVCCPACGTGQVAKAPMAPRVPRKGNQQDGIARSVPLAKHPLPPEAQDAMRKLAALQAEALKQSRWVGEKFAEHSRAMHYGEREAETIHGQASLSEARDLLEEGIGVMPLLLPVAPPDVLN
jgi:hypothetical protein